MIRALLRLLNAPLLLFGVILGIAVQSSLFNPWPLCYFRPDTVLWVTLWCALRRNFIEGGALTLMVAEIAELHSSVPQGVYLLTYFLIYGLVRLSMRFFVLSSVFTDGVLAAGSSLLSKLIVFLVMNLLGCKMSQWQHVFQLMILTAGVQAALVHWVFAALERFDELTLKPFALDPPLTLKQSH